MVHAIYSPFDIAPQPLDVVNVSIASNVFFG